MTRGQRRAWLALEEQNRRRVRAAQHSPSAGLRAGLVAHFGFEEVSGNRIDDVNGFVLAPARGNVGSAPGRVGNAVAFDGAGGYLAGTEETPAFTPTAAGFAVSIWVNFTTVTDPYSTTYIASIWDDAIWPGGSVWNLSANPGYGSAQGEAIGPISYMTDLGGSGDLSGWVHLCLVHEPVSGQWVFYLNGTLANAAEGDYNVLSGKLGVGAHTNPITDPPDYLVDELSIWSRALSAAEVAQLYNHGNGLAFANY